MSDLLEWMFHEIEYGGFQYKLRSVLTSTPYRKILKLTLYDQEYKEKPLRVPRPYLRGDNILLIDRPHEVHPELIDATLIWMEHPCDLEWPAFIEMVLGEGNLK